MGKDYEALHYIQNQCDKHELPLKIKSCLQNAFNLLYDKKSGDDCLSTTAALYICFKMLGVQSRICYGLCKTDMGGEFYHAWLELDDKIIDLAIYGNLRFSPYAPECSNSNPVVMEPYDYSPV